MNHLQKLEELDMFSLKLSVVLSLSAAMTAVAVVPAYGQCGGSGWAGLHLFNIKHWTWLIFFPSR